MKNFTLAVICMINLLMSSTVTANEADAKRALRAILLETSSFVAQFDQIVVNELGEELQTTSGNITVGKPNKLRWEVTQPDETISIADGTSVFNIDPFVEQVTVFDQSQVIRNNPLALLMTDSEKEWQNVSVQMRQEQFVVTPLASEGSIVELVMVFDKANRLTQLIATDLQGQTNKISFSDIKLNPMLSLNLFIPEIPDGYVVDDQR